MLANPHIARITAAKKRIASHHGMTITTSSWTEKTLSPYPPGPAETWGISSWRPSGKGEVITG
jgi:hypothetical protein